jgi:DNA-binding CsgD family transcriptional regulator/catechol 2,3-dioxygenase-like lactoylglutathione lyase family enzyme
MASKRRGRPPHDDVLTPAEWRIAHAVQHGMTDREIAERRGISREGVKFHVDNIREKLGLRTRKALRGWFLPPKDSALARQGRHTVKEPELGPIGQISRTVADVERAERWYREMLGVRHLYTFGKLAFFDCGGIRLLLTQEASPPGTESILYFRVDDIALAHRRLQEKGVEFINAPHLIHRHADGVEEWMAFFKDPEGRPLAIMSRVAAGA